MTKRIRLIVNPRKRPTPQHVERAKVADLLFTGHNDLNILIGDAVTRIMRGAEIQPTLDRLRPEMARVVDEMTRTSTHEEARPLRDT